MSRIEAFTTDQVSRLTGLSPRVLRYWEETLVFAASYIDERPRVPYRRIYSFRDVVSLRTLALLRQDYGVKLDQLRRSARFLRETYPDVSDPWSELRYGVLNHHVVFRDPRTGDWQTAAPPGQTILPIDVAQIARHTERDAAAFISRQPADMGQIVRHRYVLRNAWRIAGTRIPTSAIWHFHEDGADTNEIRRAYPDLTEADVAAALAHERGCRGLSAA